MTKLDAMILHNAHFKNRSFCDDLYGGDFCEDPVEYPQELVDKLLEDMEEHHDDNLKTFFERKALRGGGGDKRRRKNGNRRKNHNQGRQEQAGDDFYPRLPRPQSSDKEAVPISSDAGDDDNYEDSEDMAFDSDDGGFGLRFGDSDEKEEDDEDDTEGIAGRAGGEDVSSDYYGRQIN